MWIRLANVVLALFVGTAGGFAFYYLRLPLPWTLGSLFATAIAVILGREWLLPANFRNIARPLVGVLAGSAFSPVVVAALIESWPVILYVACYSILITGLGFLLFRWGWNYDLVTAFFASTPGGLSELILVGSQLGANMHTLVVVHTIRIVMVVFTVPFAIQLITEFDLSGPGTAYAAHATMSFSDWAIIGACCAAGYIAANHFRMQGGAIIAALVTSAIAHAAGWTQAIPPQWLVAAVQVVIGASAGARFAGLKWIEVRVALIHATIWAASMLGVAALMAIAGSAFFDRTFPALLLAISPGGLPEMTIVTYALGIEVAFVVTCHVCRVFMVLIAGPAIGSRLNRRT